MASVIFKIIVTLLRRVGWVRFPHSPAIAVAALLLIAVPVAPRRMAAQQRDSARAGVAAPKAPTQPAPDTTPRPPLSPRRAFLTSLVLPGYAQTVFGRDRAAMLFAVIEVGAIGMARKAAQDLREAKTAPRDSVVTSYETDGNGLVVIDPKTGQPIPATYSASRFTPDRIKARRTHYEDWIAAIVFNHLFSGADAYVAANLWDFRANLEVAAGPRSAAIVASLRLR